MSESRRDQELVVAASAAPVRGCVAFAPVADVEAHLGPELIATLERVSPGIAGAIHETTPSNRVEAIHCPVFLFHARDDENVSPASVMAFRDLLLLRQKTVSYVPVNSGGHYDSMLNEGIPKAVTWLKAIDQGKSRP